MTPRLLNLTKISNPSFYFDPLVYLALKSAELKNSVFLGKNFYKANTLANVSLGYVDHLEKIPYLSHMGNLVSKPFFLITHAPYGEKLIFPNIDLLYIIFSIFYPDQLSLKNLALQM